MNFLIFKSYTFFFLHHLQLFLSCLPHHQPGGRDADILRAVVKSASDAWDFFLKNSETKILLHC